MDPSAEAIRPRARARRGPRETSARRAPRRLETPRDTPAVAVRTFVDVH